MPEFVDAAFYQSALPLRFAPLLKGLSEFMGVNVAARSLPPGAERDAMVADLRDQHDELLREAAVLLPPGATVDPARLQAAFVSGALRALHYQGTVLGNPPLVDTAGSKTLSGFATDLADQPPGAVEDALARAFVLKPGWQERLERRLDHELSQLTRRRRISLAVDARFPLTPGQDNRRSVEGLFRALYPEHPLPEGVVQLVRTASTLFFCVPLHTSPEAGPVADFYDRLTHFEPSFSAHFPSFGSLTSGRVPQALAQRLAEDSQLTVEQVSATLPTMVVVLPSDKLDQFIVHDAWGHGWQALLFRFEETYQRASRSHRLPPLDQPFTWTRDGQAHSASFRQLVKAQLAGLDAGQALDLGDYEAWLHAATAARLFDSLAGLNAEVLADVVEYKYLALNPGHEALLPSSSFVKERPAKLDLTLLDLPMYYRQALRGFKRFAEQGRVVDALERVFEHPQEERVLQAFADFTDAWLERVHGEDLCWTRAPNQLRANTMCRAALNYLGLHAKFNAVYTELRQQTGGVRFADLLVFSCAALLEEDWAGAFWHMDELLDDFPALYERFAAALSER